MRIVVVLPAPFTPSSLIKDEGLWLKKSNFMVGLHFYGTAKTDSIHPGPSNS